MNTSTTVIGACPHDCPDTCSWITTIEDGRAVKVAGNPAHPATAGVLCTKVARYAERTNHAGRVLHPLRRVGAKGSGGFARIGWDEALAEIAAKLKTIAGASPIGAEAVLPYSYCGTMGQVQGEAMASRFFNRLGASRLERTICASAGAAGLTHTLGGKVGMRVEFFAESKLILIWGSNSIASNLHFWRIAQEAKRAGAKLVCIDPRRSETAEKCHEHLQLLPGTDAALAYALMHELVAHDRLDHNYLVRHTLGWERLRERALEWPPARAAEVCGVPQAQIESLARDYGTTKPAAIRLNYGMQRAAGGGNATRAIACLPALVGAWRHRAGGLLLSTSGEYPVDRAALQRPDLLAGREPRTINMSTIGRDLTQDDSIRAIVVYNSNPMAVAPQSRDVAAGFMRGDLYTVVVEQFMTDTADVADIVLPATTQLEHWDIHTSYGHTDVLLNRPAIAPMGEARSNARIFAGLARAMGYGDACFDDDDEAICRQAFGDRIDFDRLMRDGFAPLGVPDAPFAAGGFPTASGRCEFHSAALERECGDGLPRVITNVEPAGADPAHPLAMISPPARNFLNSSFVNVESLRSIEGEPLVEMHAADAGPRGIASGDTVRVYNTRGEYRCKAEVSARARPGVVNGLGIWWRKSGLAGTNVNELTGQRLTDLGRGPTFYDCAVEVERA